MAPTSSSMKKKQQHGGDNLVLEGRSEVHANGSSDFTLNGSVSGSGTYDSRGASKVLQGET